MRIGWASLLIGASLVMAPFAMAQTGDDPVGWPYRPPERHPVTPMPVPATPMPQQDRPDRQAQTPPGSTRPADAGDRLTLRPRPDADIGPIERVILPVRPLEFSYKDDRAALTRDETTRLMRTAERLRLGDARIAIVSWAPPGAKTPRAGLEIALTRALYVRSFLVHEGVPLARIDLKALPSDHPGYPEDSLYGHLSVKTEAEEKMRSLQ